MLGCQQNRWDTGEAAGDTVSVAFAIQKALLFHSLHHDTARFQTAVE